jgi:hypothetical protein
LFSRFHKQRGHVRGEMPPRVTFDVQPPPANVSRDALPPSPRAAVQHLCDLHRPPANVHGRQSRYAGVPHVSRYAGHTPMSAGRRNVGLSNARKRAVHHPGSLPPARAGRPSPSSLPSSPSSSPSSDGPLRHPSRSASVAAAAAAAINSRAGSVMATPPCPPAP